MAREQLRRARENRSSALKCDTTTRSGANPWCLIRVCLENSEIVMVRSAIRVELGKWRSRL